MFASVCSSLSESLKSKGLLLYWVALPMHLQLLFVDIFSFFFICSWIGHRSSGLTNTVKFSRVDCSSTRHIMNKENITSAKIEEPTVRITRARAKAATKSGGLLPPKPPIKLDQMQVVRTNSKRPASNENKPSATANAGLQHKRRATLKDVTNVVSENSYMNCISTTKVEARILSFFELYIMCNFHDIFVLNFYIGKPNMFIVIIIWKLHTMILLGLHSTPKRILVLPNFIHLSPYFF